MMRLAMDGLLSYSFLPLRLGLCLGLLSILLSMGFLLYNLYALFTHNTDLPLNEWINVIIFGFIGLQFIILWFIGENTNEIHRCPMYIIEEEVNFKSDTE